jgi:ATP-dependent RNA helicase DOB1
MKDLINLILTNNQVDKVFSYVLENLFRKGPISTTDLEILSYLALYRPDEFEKHKASILNYMAIYYKPTPRDTLREVIFGQYARHIRERYDADYTPVQADIMKGIANNKCFSFSAPTSTGKSFVFMNMINNAQKDVVVVVPSRALINEYYLKLCSLIKDKTVNILTFIDKINTKHTKKNVFIVTPERCRELFKQKQDFQIDHFLFDEAQLSNEESKRGLYFDSIVRRCMRAFPEAKYIFAHPFVKNPESQIQKNHFEEHTSDAVQYVQKNVGQIFLCREKEGAFYHFGVEKPILGNRKVLTLNDPIENTITNGGSVLFYVSKSKIYSGEVLSKFEKYVSMCPEHPKEKIQTYIDQLVEYTGGDTNKARPHYSLLLDLLKRGIVVHHGSLPLQTRLIIEQFTKDGLCRICFATSTLEQGINMPFDVVFLDRLEGSKPLAVKNLIGRAGRSTTEFKFDFGFVIINSSTSIPKFRKIMVQDEILDNVSSLEKPEKQDDDYNDFRDAIVNGTFSDEFNLTEKELEKLSSESIDGVVERILDAVFDDDEVLSFDTINTDLDFKLSFYNHFNSLYSLYLGRPLQDGERNVHNTAIKIIFWKIYGKTFKNICWYRYSYASKSRERENLKQYPEELNALDAAFFTPYNDLPDKNLNVYSLFPIGTKAMNVSYDLIMYDTYDFIDKLIGFKLSDIYYATFTKYYEKYVDARANKIAKLIKFGTDNERTIWMLRYGLSFEDIEILDEHIETIGSEEIVFRNSIQIIPDELKFSVERFLN